MQVEIPCPKCGKTRMNFPRPQPLDDDIITCYSCNFELGTYGSVKTKMARFMERVRQEAVAQAQAARKKQ